MKPQKYMPAKNKQTPIDELLNKPHAERSIEERVRCCEHAIKLLCDYNDRNAKAVRTAWMDVPLD